MAESSDLQAGKTAIKNVSKRILRRFGLAWLQSEQVRKILRLLGEGNCQAEVAEKMRKDSNSASFSRQKVNYWAKKFVDRKLLFCSKESNIKTYELTAYGKKILTGSERGVSEQILMESYDLKFRLRSVRPRDCSKCCEVGCVRPVVGETNDCVILWKKLGDPRNWAKWGFHFFGVSVERNDGVFPTIVIRSGELSGSDPYALVAEAGGVIEAVRAKLSDLGVETDSVGVPLHEPLFHTYTPESEELYNKGGVVYTPDGHIDDSPLRNDKDKGSRQPHEERNFSQQVSYMAMPRRVEENLSLSKQNSEKLDELQLEFKGLTSGGMAFSQIAQSIPMFVNTMRESAATNQGIMGKLEEKDARRDEVVEKLAAVATEFLSSLRSGSRMGQQSDKKQVTESGSYPDRVKLGEKAMVTERFQMPSASPNGIGMRMASLSAKLKSIDKNSNEKLLPQPSE